MSPDYIEIATIGEKVIAWGYDRNGELRQRELTEEQQRELSRIHARANADEQKLLAKVLEVWTA